MLWSFIAALALIVLVECGIPHNFIHTLIPQYPGDCAEIQGNAQDIPLRFIPPGMEIVLFEDKHCRKDFFKISASGGVLGKPIPNRQFKSSKLQALLRGSIVLSDTESE